MANNLTIDDVSVLANTILADAQGITDGSTQIDAENFVAVAQTALKTGYDPLMTAINQVMTRTIFAERPYSQKFNGLTKDAERWGNHVRKLNMLDKPMEQDNRLYDENGNLLADGASVDMYKINAPKVLQTNFYGESTMQKTYTIWKNQLDTAFTGLGEFGNFLTMVATNNANVITQAREDLSRLAVCNLIGATIYEANPFQVVNLFEEYQKITGDVTTDFDDILKPANYKAFMQTSFAVIKSVMDRMTERSVIYHVNPTLDADDGVQYLRRHTPKNLMHCYMNADFMNLSETAALSNTFHDDYLKVMDYEPVTFWQTIQDPLRINVKGSHYGYKSISSVDGSVVTNTLSDLYDFQIDTDTDEIQVIGVLFDDDALGVTRVNQWAANSQFNSLGGYTNHVDHETNRWYMDNSENVVVFILKDTAVEPEPGDDDAKVGEARVGTAKAG